MKQTIRTMSALLTMMAAMAIFSFIFTACSDDEDADNEVTYTYGFPEMSASHPNFIEEMGKIENAFKSALGVTGKNFTKRGTVEECDKQVYEACEKACNSLKGEVWQGDYLFEVRNTLTGELVCIATFNADNENIFGGSSKSAEEKTAKNITDFVKKLDPGFPASGSGHTTLTCTDFKNQTEVYAFVCREIISVSDSEAKSWFFTIKAFNSEYVHVVYETERVKDGFASLNIVFKKEKNQPKYYVVFRSPNN